MKRKFVKVMLFGALTLAVSTTGQSENPVGMLNLHC